MILEYGSSLPYSFFNIRLFKFFKLFPKDFRIYEYQRIESRLRIGRENNEKSIYRQANEACL